MCAWWLEQVLQHPPGDADTEGAYWREVVWLLEWLVDGLRGPADLDILRRNNVFEKMMALFFHPALSRGGKFTELLMSPEKLATEASLQAKVRPLVLKLVLRAACTEGATMLVTGAGVLAWLGDVKSKGGLGREGGEVVNQIMGIVLGQCNQAKAKEWSGGVLCREDAV